MDPNACLNRILDAIMDEDWQEAHDALNELQLWTGRGGFKPTDPRVRLAQLEEEKGTLWDKF